MLCRVCPDVGMRMVGKCDVGRRIKLRPEHEMTKGMNAARRTKNIT